MVKVSQSSQTITVTRGDTVDLPLTIYTRDGQVYVPEEGEVVRFALKKKYTDAEPLIEKVLDNSNLRVRLEAEETKMLENPKSKGAQKIYCYDVQITRLDGSVDTFIYEAELIVTPEVS